MKITEQTPSRVLFEQPSLAPAGCLIAAGVFFLMPALVFGPIMLWGSLGENILNCQKIEPQHSQCTVEKWNFLGKLQETVVLHKLKSANITTEQGDEVDKYLIHLRFASKSVLFFSSVGESAPANDMLERIRAFLDDPSQNTLLIKTPPESRNDFYLALGVSLLLFFVFARSVWFYLSYKATHYDFDQRYRKLFITKQNRLKKLSTEEIPFSQIKRVLITSQSKEYVDDDESGDEKNRIRFTFTLLLELDGTQSLELWKTWFSAKQGPQAESLARPNDMLNLGNSITQISGAKLAVPPEFTAIAPKVAKDSPRPAPPTPRLAPKTSPTPTTPAKSGKSRFLMYALSLALIGILALGWAIRPNVLELGLYYFYLLTPDPVADEFSPWLSEQKYQSEWERMAKKRYYPVTLEGRQNEEGQVEYRAVYAPYPEGAFWFYSFYSISDAVYLSKHKRLIKKDFTLVWHQAFTDAQGQKHNQAIWVKRR